MAKKKEITVKIDGGNRSAVSPGDVNIFYGRDLIAGLSDDSTARLETENTICEQDIGVEYTKPSSPLVGAPVTVTNNTEDVLNIKTYSSFYRIIDGLAHSVQGNGIINANVFAIPFYGQSSYVINIDLLSDTDDYDVTLNGDAIEFDREIGSYPVNYESALYPTEFSVVISAKSESK